MTPVFPEPHRSEAPIPEVAICEVGPRDGLQAEKQIVATADKVAFIERLASAGLDTIEATSFVSPRWVPQLADSAEVFAGVRHLKHTRLPVLVPNERGLERALEAGVESIAVFVSATESFARNNLNAGRQEVLAGAERVTSSALSSGLRVRGYVSMCFGDPWEGRVPIGEVLKVARRLFAAGCSEVSLGDTIGVATAGHVRALLGNFDAEERTRIALHAHDTYGQALSNVLAGLDSGIRIFDAAAGGLGGCPFAGSATGNLATEDLIWMLEGSGVRTGVDLRLLTSLSRWMADLLGRTPPSSVVGALSA